ncbi:MAG: hypothetical protein GC204_06330 [Chloroflexi bacterium]|nr:hypothetical protein [Chloroflexota bacterium]
MLRWLVVPLLILCAACGSETTGSQLYPTATKSADGVLTIARAQQVDAPALVVSGGQLIAAWIGADERGVHQDVRRFSDQGYSEAVTLPLPPTHPYGQQLFPGADGATHLLWLDADQAQQTNLYAALLTPDLAVERGPVPVSEGLALDFSAVPDGTGGLWTVWSGGQFSELILYMRRIDAEGRPLFDKVALASNATNPSLVRSADGQVWVFWVAEGQLLCQRIDLPDQTTQALTSAISLASGDRLINVRAALDATHAYFFWNVTRASGLNETWWTTGTLGDTGWRQPTRLTAGAGAALRWTVPLSSQPQTLIAAVESDTGLGIISLSAGALIGFTTLRASEHLIGFPALVVNAAGSFDLAWSAVDDTSANLQLLTIPK